MPNEIKRTASQPPRPKEFCIQRCVITAEQREELYGVGSSVCIPDDLRKPVRELNGLGDAVLEASHGFRLWNLADVTQAFGAPDIRDVFLEGKLVDATWGFVAYGRGQEQLFLVEAFTQGVRVDLLAPVRMMFAGPVLGWLHSEQLRFKTQYGTKT